LGAVALVKSIPSIFSANSSWADLGSSAAATTALLNVAIGFAEIVTHKLLRTSVPRKRVGEAD
jgi:hypothetical protein